MEKYRIYRHKTRWIYKQNTLKIRFSCFSDLPDSREKILDLHALVIM
jgi:hypothetical protein